MSEDVIKKPTQPVSIAETFGFDSSMQIDGLSELTENVPDIDQAYRFDPDVTEAILSGFQRNRRVLIQGLHGTGKTTHVEQVAARLNWPCVRVNLDGHISRMELVGRDQIVMKDGKQVIEFQEGIIPWALQQPMALILDEYDSARPEVMFVIQRLLEREGKFTLLEQNRVITPHPQFRLFATANTVGLGNTTGLYHGARLLNQAQLDRWNITVALNYLNAEMEQQIVKAQVPSMTDEATLTAMRAMAELTREGFVAGDISTLMTPRTLINWAENIETFGDVAKAFRLTFLNRCDEAEHPIIAEYYQRCFSEELV